MHLTTLIPYPRFTKIIVDHILTENPDIPKRLNESYHKVKHDDVVKSIFNSKKNKGLGMKISEWMLTEEMKQTNHYKLYAAEFGLDVPMTHAQRKSTIIRIPRGRQSDPEQPILSAAQIDIASLDEATQMSLTRTRSIEDFKAQQAIKGVDDHLVDEEIQKLV
ncbi:hypothetical protein Tco_1452062, partial [Tanacetum coccineum]